MGCLACRRRHGGKTRSKGRSGSGGVLCRDESGACRGVQGMHRLPALENQARQVRRHIFYSTKTVVFPLLSFRFRTCRKACLQFVCIFGACFNTVFTGQKINGLLFKISGSDFEIRATNFFIAPMLGLRVENQFSFFPAENAVFCRQIPHFPGADASRARPAALFTCSGRRSTCF